MAAQRTPNPQAQVRFLQPLPKLDDRSPCGHGIWVVPQSARLLKRVRVPLPAPKNYGVSRRECPRARGNRTAGCGVAHGRRSGPKNQAVLVYGLCLGLPSQRSGFESRRPLHGLIVEWSRRRRLVTPVARVQFPLGPPYRGNRRASGLISRVARVQVPLPQPLWDSNRLIKGWVSLNAVALQEPGGSSPRFPPIGS